LRASLFSTTDYATSFFGQLPFATPATTFFLGVPPRHTAYSTKAKYGLEVHIDFAHKALETNFGIMCIILQPGPSTASSPEGNAGQQAAQVSRLVSPLCVFT